MALNNKAKALAAAVNKKHGEGTVVLAKDMHIPRRYTSGSLGIDISIGGGWPANQWSEVIGHESHGKTAVVLKTIAANQAADPGFTTLWIASEPYDLDQAAALGVDTTRVEVVPTTDAEFAFELVIQFLDARAVDCVVIDSLPGLTADDEKNKDMDEFSVAAMARLVAKFFRKVGAAGKRDPLNDHDAPWLGLIINQWRVDIGAWSPGGTPLTTYGGKAKNYSYYIRLEVKRAEWLTQTIPGKGSTKVGQEIRTKAIKSKASPPQRAASVDFYFTDARMLGFERGDYDLGKDVFTMAVLFDIITRNSPKGAQYLFEDQTWTGVDNLLEDLRSDSALRDRVSKAVIVKSEQPQDKRTWDEEDVAATIPPEPKRRRRVVKA